MNRSVSHASALLILITALALALLRLALRTSVSSITLGQSCNVAGSKSAPSRASKSTRSSFVWRSFYRSVSTE